MIFKVAFSILFFDNYQFEAAVSEIIIYKNKGSYTPLSLASLLDLFRNNDKPQ
jgi:hypothetical protein